MYYYVLPKIGKGTDDDGCRPDVPAGISYIAHECPFHRFLVGTQTPIPGIKPLTISANLQNFCYNNRLNFDDVFNKWFLR